MQVSAEEIQELWEYFTPEEREEILQSLDAFPAVIWSPLPGPQTMAWNSEADVIGFGGSAGGGKTDLGCGFANRKHRRTMILRKNGTEHAAMIDRLEQLLGSRNGYRASPPPSWRLPDDRQIDFAAVPDPGDAKKYQGRPHDFLMVDEATNVPRADIEFLSTWIRTTTPGQKCRMLLTFNPPTDAEGRWVIEYFAPWLDPNYPGVKAEAGELRWFARLDGKDIERPNGEPFEWNGEVVLPKSRTFIPSRVTDNPYLMGTNYMSQLQSLPEPLRSQMLYGDFMAGVKDDAMQVIPTEWVDIAVARWKDLHPKPEMDSLGVDVARGGDDFTIIARRHGQWYDVPLEYPGKQTPDGPSTSGLVIAATRDGAVQHIDVIGVGSSPYDFLRTANQQVVGVVASEGAPGTDRSGLLKFSNVRSMLWWRFRELLDPANNSGIALPPSDRLKKDLTAPRWKLSGRAIQVESRDDIIKRIGRSPDWASAYIMAAIETPKQRQVNALPAVAARRNDYDPYENL